MAKHSKLQKTALAASTFLALASVHFNGNAQADSATVTITGSIAATTCNIVATDANGAGGDSTRTMLLGSVPPASDASAPGTLMGTAIATVFQARSATGNGTACTFGGTNTKWDLALSLVDAQITPNNLLANSVATTAGGTNAGVQLKGGVGNTAAAAVTAAGAATALTLTTGSTVLGGNAATFTALAGSSIALTAQFAKNTAAGTAVSAGGYQQTIVLQARYQ